MELLEQSMSPSQPHPEQHVIRLRTHDGFLLYSHLLTKHFTRKEEILEIPIVLEIHGLLGHFLARGTPRLLPYALLERGWSSLSINTRLAFAGQMNGRGIFHDTINDLDAAVEFLTQEGFRNIFLLGYSLGASMVVHWASKRTHSNVKGLILEGAHYSIPESQRHRLATFGSDPTYDEIYERAKALLGEDPYNSPHDEIFIIYKARGPTRQPLHDEIFTYKTWWHMMGPEAHAAMANKHIGKVQLPMLIVRGEHDPLIEEWEASTLAHIAETEGNHQVKIREIPRAGHDCMENPDAMLHEIALMLTASSLPYTHS